MNFKFATALVAGIALAASSPAAYAKDPCSSLLCMLGKADGSISGIDGGNEAGCKSGIGDFFSIVATHHGHMDVAATRQNRLSYLNSCTASGATAGQLDSIISMFGTATL